MKSIRVFSLIVGAAALIAGNVHALDDDALGIEWATANYTSYKYMTTLRGMVGCEIGVHNQEDWALVCNGGGGKIDAKADLDDQQNLAIWCVDAGLKYYFTVKDSLSLLASWEWADSAKDYEMAGGVLALKHRFLDATEPISPYVGLNGGLYDAKVNEWTGAESDKFNALLVRCTIGCDFKLRDDSIIGIEGSRTDSRSVSSESELDNFADGFSASVVFKYFWN